MMDVHLNPHSSWFDWVFANYGSLNHTELNSTCHSLAERIIGEISGDMKMITELTTVIIRNLCPRQEFKKIMYFMTSQCVPYS